MQTLKKNYHFGKNNFEIKKLDYYDFETEKETALINLSNLLNSCHILTNKKDEKIIDVISAFDIETSRVEDGINGAGNPCGFSFMYTWQYCFMTREKKDYILFLGRTWESFLYFQNFLKDFLIDKKIITYVHNLSYEFQFMRKFLKWENIFAKKENVVLKCATQNVEFRCSYFLTNKSLDKFLKNCKNITFFKQVGNLNYDIIRTPSSCLNRHELLYTLVDVYGLCEGIIYLLNEYNDTLTSIPLTSTSYIRRDVRKNMQKNANNRFWFKNSKVDLYIYNFLKEVFRGGNTHANRYYVKDIQKNVISFDITSSYPFVMVVEKFPVGQFKSINIKSFEHYEKLKKKYALLLDIDFTNLRLKGEHISVPYISFSKCKYIQKNDKGLTIDNGRILSATFLNIRINEIDLDIILSQYDFDNIYINESFFSEKTHLPFELLEKIIEYFNKKTSLKNVDKYEYLKSKENLNGIYGMSVSDILHMDIDYIDEVDRIFKKREYSDIEKNEKLNEFFSSYNSFLPYQIGVWVTSYARKNLQKAINFIDNLDGKNKVSKLIYCDTDSIKSHFDVRIINFFEEYNKKIKRIKYPYGLKNYATNSQGLKSYLGIFENEGNKKTFITYKFFVTLGAKKYATQNKRGIIDITVAGLNKRLGYQLRGNLNNFKTGFIFKEDKKRHLTARTTAYYNNNDIHYIYVNNEKILSASNLAIFPATYTLGIEKNFNILIDNLKNS